MSVKVAIGRNIKGHRKQKVPKMSREKLANMVDMSPTYLARIERGDANPTVEMLERIADGLGVPFDEIVMVGKQAGTQEDASL